jgi:hypothetical protein
LSYIGRARSLEPVQAPAVFCNRGRERTTPENTCCVCSH